MQSGEDRQGDPFASALPYLTLLKLTSRAFIFRPALIVPLPGAKAKTTTYALLHRIVPPSTRRCDASPTSTTSAVSPDEAFVEIMTPTRVGPPRHERPAPSVDRIKS
ncbi:hypothetical protein [Nonomuraea sp. NPDC001699]